MSGRIYIQEENGALHPLDEAACEAEAVLQAELADHPDLLAGEQMDPAEPRRWLLVRREAGIPDREAGGVRWQVDHVFLDQDAVPTFVEAKRKSDTRLRREVVGQVLDYVSNAVVYWTDETLQTEFARDCEMRGEDPDDLLGGFVGDPELVDDFWDRARTNLRAGKVRVVFVADDVLSELRRIVEFLNGQTDPMEILAVEVRRYEGAGFAALVPRVIGQTTEAQARKSSARQKRMWDEGSILDVIAKDRGAEIGAAAERLLRWAHERGLTVSFGEGAVTGTAYPMVDLPDGDTAYTFGLRTAGRLEPQFAPISRHAPYDEEEKREELRRQLDSIPGVEIPEDGIDRYPRIPLDPLTDQSNMDDFLSVWDQYIAAVGAANEAS